ncbi:MAG: hypothetical protein E7345_04755 [Clostridiales bacterium]|nr:hypothetical protein [Clostridiales bacterium]
MIKLKLETNTEEEKLIKEYLENNASETLADKINNGTKIIKDNKQLLNKKDFNGFLNYAKEQAKSSVKNGVAMIHHETVFGWAIHYFEEDSIEGTLYNEDGTEYKKIVKTEYKPPVTKVEVKKKPENEQANFLDMFSNQNKQEENEVEEETIEEKKIENPLTREQMELLVKTFDEPELEEELRLLDKQEKQQKEIIEKHIDMETGEVLTTQMIDNELIEILNKLLDNKLKVSI